MKVSNFLISIVTIAAGVAIASPANAQGARFNFAPQKFRMDEGGVPKSNHYSGPVGTVSRGNVPKMNYLGVDPAILRRPAPQIAAQPQPMTNVFPNLIPQQPAAFNNAFGKPMQPQSASATPNAMTVPPLPAAKSMSKPQLRSAEHVQGRLRTPVKPRYIARSANAGSLSKPVASYGNNFGYVPGNTAPASSGASTSVSSSVNGRVVGH